MSAGSQPVTGVSGTRAFLLASALLCGVSSTARADRPILAVFDVQDKGSGLSADILDKLVDYLVAHLAEGGYNVVPRDQLRERLKEQQRESYKACYDQTCQIELGRELAAQKALATTFLRLGDTCHVTSVLYDLKRAATDRAATAEAACELSAMVEAMKEVARKLCAALVAPDAGPGGRADDHGDHADSSPPEQRPAPPRPGSPGFLVASPRSVLTARQYVENGVVITLPEGARPQRVKLSNTRIRFETKKEKLQFTTDVYAADGRSYTCPKVQLGQGCSLPRLAAGQASLVVRCPGLGPFAGRLELADDQELWIYTVRTVPKVGSILSWTFGGLALATGAALVPVGFAVDTSGMYIAGFASLAAGAGLIWLGFIFPPNVSVHRDDYENTMAERPTAPRRRSFVLVPSFSGASVVGQF